MSVEELILALQAIEDKSLEVKIGIDTGNDGFTKRCSFIYVTETKGSSDIIHKPLIIYY